MTEITKLAAISGEGGLFVIATPLKNGVMLESLDDKKTKMVAGAHSKVSILSEISIYTTTADGSVPLEDVLKSLFSLYGENLPVTSKSDSADLRKVLTSVLKEADLERVYVSDIKKLVSWYHILVKFAPEVLKASVAEAVEPAAEEKAEKPKAKKAASKKASV
jgi:Domain of unknown function (DUF5606)